MEKFLYQRRGFPTTLGNFGIAGNGLASQKKFSIIHSIYSSKRNSPLPRYAGGEG